MCFVTVRMEKTMGKQDAIEFFEVFADKFKRCLRVTVEPLFEEDGLKIYHLVLLSVIGRHEGMCQKEITSHLPYDKSRVSMVVNELHAMGMVENVGKGKLRSIVLTDRGHEVEAAFREAVTDLHEQMFSPLRKDEREQFLLYLGLFNDKLDKILENHSR